MNRKFLPFLIFGLLLSVVFSFNAEATHLKGGEITVRRVSKTALTYEFTLTTYTEKNPANDAQDSVFFCFGDGSKGFWVRRINGTNKKGETLPDGSIKNIYKTNYTYQAPAPAYKVSAGIKNRNADVKNVPNSVQTSFYVETVFSINSGLGLNATPVLLNPAVDLTAVVGQKFIHNPNAVDAEGDSLAYRLVQCKYKNLEEICTDGLVILGFVQPNEVAAGQNQAGTGAATFTIDAKTGDLIWDAPAAIGKYNCAFIVEEWRNGVKISETVRDMQIEVKDTDNKPPQIKVPNDICVEAGTLINQTITALDQPAKNNRIDQLNFFSTGAVYKQTDVSIPDFINPAFAVFTAVNPVNSPGSGVFKWQTGCTHVRNETYDVLFKVEDVPPVTFPKLVDSKIWKIKVVAPKPKNVKATYQLDTKTINVTWDAYACSALTGVEIIVYRKEGCTNATVDVCKPVLPAGYVEIGRVAANVNSFEDKDPNIKAGVSYSYRTGAKFIGSNGNEVFSAVSDESCLSFPRTMGVITNVTVDKTDTKIGEITVKWTRPPVDTKFVKGPYEYRVNRATGLNGASFTQVSGNITTDLSPAKADTIFTDKNLNTQDNAYRYRIDFYYTVNNTLTRYDSTYAASSVRLAATAGQKVVELAWQANVPWKNDNQKHRVYREDRTKKGTFNLIAEVAVTNQSTFRYSDDGKDTFLADGNATIKLSADSNYCYRVETVGTYNDPAIKPDLLYNFSQVSCASPKDTVRPCAPNGIIALDKLTCDDYIKQESNCSLTSFDNKLNWKASIDDCGKDVVSYNIYYKRYDDDKFEKVGSVNAPTQTFTHSGLKSYAGYYIIKAVNKYGTESLNSNIVSIDNCPSFNLPNVFTPNGDGKNDKFTPLKCPRFVLNVNITIYNRYGSKVWEYNGLNANIDWDGRGTDGGELPSGTYYYICETIFDVLQKGGASQTLKGWVEILR